MAGTSHTRPIRAPVSCGDDDARPGNAHAGREIAQDVRRPLDGGEHQFVLEVKRRLASLGMSER